MSERHERAVHEPPSLGPRSASPDAHQASLRAIDVDVHPRITDWKAIAPFVPAGLRHRVLRGSGPPMARHGFKVVGDPYGDVPLPAGGAHPAGDPAWVKEHYLAARDVDLAVLTTDLTSLGVQPNADMAAAIARGVNDWLLETWVRPFTCYKGSILVAPQDPAQAVAEIARLGDEPGMVQVLMGSAAETPLGRRQYHPLYEACTHYDLPLALHLGGEGAGMSPPATAVGHPSTYFEWYGAIPQNYMAHITSMITEGVFTKYPTLRVVLYEGGILWLPHLMWRFDKNWKAQRAETPWVVEPPSTSILRHFFSATYPLEAVGAAAMADVLEMIAAERTLLFSSNYPYWLYGDPFAMVAEIPESLRRRVMVENALRLYGDRLLR